MSYLNKAISTLKDLGVHFFEDKAPVIPLLDQITDYGAEKVMLIAATLQQSSTFNAAVRSEISGMDISTRYADIAVRFDSIRDDAKQMAIWMSDGRLDMREKVAMYWMKATRGSVPARFDGIRADYLAVAKSVADQLGREKRILEAYVDFRMALKEAEVAASEVLATATGAVAASKQRLAEATAAVDQCGNDAPASKVSLELARDEKARAAQAEDRRYQITKDIAEDLRTAYNTAEAVFARLQQASDVKERLYQRAVSFFSTNEVVFTGLEASFNAMAGVSEATNTIEAMKGGVNKSLEALAEIGGQQLEAAIKTGYGATIQASSLQTLIDSIVDFQESSSKLIAEARAEASSSTNEIAAAAEEGKQRYARLLQMAKVA